MDAHLMAFIPFFMLSVNESDIITMRIFWREVAMVMISETRENQVRLICE